MPKSVPESDEPALIDPYAILNIPREATDKDIHKEFKRLSKIFHPDRHHTKHSKQIASRQFNRISNAKDTLLNPLSRNAFDKFGQAGVKVLQDENDEIQAYQVLPEYRDPKALEDVIRSHLRKKAEYEYEKLCPSSGDIVIAVDAVGFYKDLLNGDYDEVIIPEVSSYIVNQSLTLCPTRNVFLTIKGQSYNLISPRTYVFHKLDGDIRYHFDDQMIISCGAFVSTNSLGLHCSSQRVVFGQTVRLNLSQEFNREGRSIPSLSVDTKCSLWSNMLGQCGIKMGNESEVSCSIIRHFDEKTKTH